MKTIIRIIGRLAVGIALVFGPISNAHAITEEERQAKMEEFLQKWEVTRSNMLYQAEEYRKTHPAPTAAEMAAAQTQSEAAQEAFYEDEFATWMHYDARFPDGSP